ncbi:MAG TPA: hypothetical protein PLR50_02740 [Candidatus Rifleibacterium sp.]|jgi:hypothetical protein|nr:hypothetical protein [Candidatus Rifleibacterium sp.]
MSEAELLKLLWSNLPTLAVVIGIAKIYLKVSTLFARIESQTMENTQNIKQLFKLHLKNHKEDAVEILENRNGQH